MMMMVMMMESNEWNRSILNEFQLLFFSMKRLTKKSFYLKFQKFDSLSLRTVYFFLLALALVGLRE